VKVRKITLLSLYLLLCINLLSLNFNVSIWGDRNIREVYFKVLNGNYLLYIKGKQVIDIPTDSVLKLRLSTKKMIEVIYNNSFICSSDSIVIEGKGFKPYFKIYIDSLDNEYVYENNLLLFYNDKSIRMINDVDVENYVAGVVQAESGNKATIEYYKVQAIICRTYAIAYLNRHIDEGYELCDKAHCQVYKGKCTNPEILMATYSTRGKIIVDDDSNVINASFHANCGGMTENSENVWQKDLSYLKSVTDTYCIVYPQARWIFKIKESDFINYLADKWQLKKTKDNIDYIRNYSQDKRGVFFYKDSIIPLKQIRIDYQLRSTWFSIRKDSLSDTLIFIGRGSGHGVGLCQQGAMRMAELGYDYESIIKYYYRNVRIVDIRE